MVYLITIRAIHSQICDFLGKFVQVTAKSIREQAPHACGSLHHCRKQRGRVTAQRGPSLLLSSSLSYLFLSALKPKTLPNPKGMCDDLSWHELQELKLWATKKEDLRASHLTNMGIGSGQLQPVRILFVAPKHTIHRGNRNGWKVLRLCFPWSLMPLIIFLFKY